MAQINSNEKKALLHQILSNISSIQHRTEPLDYQQFKNEEAVREEVYSHLQEIGQTAGDLLIADDAPLDLRNDLELLKRFTGATHNQHTEIDHQATWQVVNNDLPEIGERLEHSESYTA